jgi:acetoin utilization protein AcuB
MIVRNWMRVSPTTITSDTLVSEANHLLSEYNLHALPVVDNGRLRGLVTRHNMLRMGHFVLRTQDPDEFNFYVNRLKVRDVMVRNPATMQIDDTMEHCLLKGQELGVAQFPVMDGDQVVGVISANEIFRLAAHLLGAWERRSGVTLAPVKLGPGVLGKIADVVEGTGAVLQAIYPLRRNEKEIQDGNTEKKIILRFRSDDVAKVVSALEEAGFPVSETSAQATAPTGWDAGAEQSRAIASNGAE